MSERDLALGQLDASSSSGDRRTTEAPAGPRNSSSTRGRADTPRSARALHRAPGPVRPLHLAAGRLRTKDAVCACSLSLSFPLPRPSLHPSLGRVALLPSSSNPPLPARAPRRISSSFETELAVVRGPNWIPVGEGVRRVSARFFLPSSALFRPSPPPTERSTGRSLFLG